MSAHQQPTPPCITPPSALSAEWIDAPEAKRPNRLMDITVTLVSGRRFEHQRRFPATFDAYDWALDNYRDIARIEVRVTADVIALPGCTAPTEPHEGDDNHGN